LEAFRNLIRGHIVVETIREIVKEYKIILRKLIAYALRLVALISLAISCKLTLVLANVLKFSDKFKSYKSRPKPKSKHNS
jgi:uncharacterized membrane protein